MRGIAVGDVMTRNFVYAEPTDSLLKCAIKITKNKINSLLLMQNKRLVGILTARDILWAITKKPSINLKRLKAIEIAIKKIAVIKPSANMLQAIEKMKTFNFRTLPVVSKGELIGIITLKDILRIQPDLYKEIGELAKIREEERKLKEANIKWPLEGFCDNCGAFAKLLKVYDKSLCLDCREELY